MLTGLPLPESLTGAIDAKNNDTHVVSHQVERHGTDSQDHGRLSVEDISKLSRHKSVHTSWTPWSALQKKVAGPNGDPTHEHADLTR